MRYFVFSLLILMMLLAANSFRKLNNVIKTRVKNIHSLNPSFSQLGKDINHPAFETLNTFLISEYGLHGTRYVHCKSGADVSSPFKIFVIYSFNADARSYQYIPLMKIKYLA
jgi:hypothetical protein